MRIIPSDSFVPLKAGEPARRTVAVGIKYMLFVKEKSISRSIMKGLLVSSVLSLPSLSLVPAVRAQVASEKSLYNFDLVAETIATGIADIGSTSGWNIAYTMKLPTLQNSVAIKGGLTVPDALEILLKGTGLSFRNVGEKSAILIDKSKDFGAESSAIMLESVSVVAHGIDKSLPVEYSGGMVGSGAKLGVLGNTDYMQAPVSFTSFTDEKIKNQQAKTIADVVKTDPSVRTSSSTGGMLDAYFIRGFPVNIGNSGEMALDGFFGVAPNYRAQSQYAERIEVLKGPTALLNGIAPNSAVGGVINIVPKRAHDEDITNITLDYGQGNQAGGHIDVGRRFGPNGELGVRFNGAYHDGDTYLDHQTKTNSLAALAVDYRGEKLRVTFDAIDQRENINAPFREIRVVSGLDVPSAPDGSENVVHDWEWSDAVDQSAMIRSEYDINDNFTLFAGIGTGRTVIDRLFGYPIIQNAAGDTTDSVSYYTFETERWTGDVGLKSQFETGFIDHKVTLQATQYNDIYSRGRTLDATVLTSNIYDPVSNAVVSVAAPSLVRKLLVTQFTGLAVTDTMSVLDDAVQLTVGARHQRVKSNGYSATDGSLTSSYDEMVVTPMVGIVVSPTETLSLYGNYLEGLSKGDIAPNTASNAGEAMAPYVSKQIEAGVKLDFGDIGATMAAFQITKPSGQTTGGVYNSDAQQRNRGIELNVFGEITDDIRILSGLMFIDAEITESSTASTVGNRPIGVPNFQANLTLEWDTPFVDGLTLASTVVHTNGQYINSDNTQKIPSWTTLDLGVRYKMEVADVPLTLRANVENVFDTSYWEGSNIYGMMSVGKPRTALFSVTAEF